MIDVLKQALEALEEAMNNDGSMAKCDRNREAQDAVRAAIEQMEKVEPAGYWSGDFSIPVFRLEKGNGCMIPLYTAPVAPEGWKLVPVEPTEGMEAAIRNEPQVFGSEGELYTALLAAAPEYKP